MSHAVRWATKEEKTVVFLPSCPFLTQDEKVRSKYIVRLHLVILFLVVICVGGLECHSLNNYRG